MNTSNSLSSRLFKILSIASLTVANSLCIAAPILDINENGQLVGASGIEVLGNVYDVAFVDTSCFDTYGSCDSDTSFTFSTREDAQAASAALLDTVFLDVSYGSFDTDPTLTNGCSYSALCKAYTSLSITPITNPYNGITSTFIEYAAANNWNNTSKTGISSGMLNLSIGADYGLDFFNDDDLWGTGGVFALWSPSQDGIQVSEPRSFALLLMGYFFLLGRKTLKRKMI